MCIGGRVIERNSASSKTVGNSAMMEAFRVVASGSAGVEDCAGKTPSGGWSAVLSVAAWSREWGQPSSRRPRLMQVDLLGNDTFSWLYTVIHFYFGSVQFSVKGNSPVRYRENFDSVRGIQKTLSKQLHPSTLS